MTPNSATAYVANLLDSTITVINTESGATTMIDLLKVGANYDPIGGIITLPDGKTPVGPVGALPIQTPVSPDGKTMVTANTLSGTITIVDPTNNNQVVKMLPCDPGCHGVQYGAKQGGGYYAYVSSKFFNSLIVVGFGSTGNAADAEIVGRILLTSPETSVKGSKSDDTVNGNFGMGGQGILTIPVVYNGWVQQWVNGNDGVSSCNTTDCSTWRLLLNDDQEAPGPLK